MSQRRWLRWGIPGLVASMTVLTIGLACNHNSPEAVVTSAGEGGMAPPNVAAGPPYFEDVTEKTGIKFTYPHGEEAGHYAILESLGGGRAAEEREQRGSRRFRRRRQARHPRLRRRLLRGDRRQRILGRT